MKLPKKCPYYSEVVKDFLLNVYLPFNKINYYINNNIYDNLWEDFKFDENLPDVLLTLKKLLQKQTIILPSRFTTESDWLYNASMFDSNIKDRSTYLRTRDSYLKDKPQNNYRGDKK